MNKRAFNHAIASHSQLALRVFFSGIPKPAQNISYLLVNIRPTPLLEQEKPRSYTPALRRRKSWPSHVPLLQPALHNEENFSPPSASKEMQIRNLGGDDERFGLARGQIVRGCQDHWSHCVLRIITHYIQYFLCWNKFIFIIVDNFHSSLKPRIYRLELSNCIIVIY